MSGNLHITGRLAVAARALTGVSQSEVANAAGIPVATLKQMEASGSAPLQPAEQAEAVRRALESFGAIFLAEESGLGAGVRLKFTRLDTKQITRLENEGGPAADDEVT